MLTQEQFCYSAFFLWVLYLLLMPAKKSRVVTLQWLAVVSSMLSGMLALQFTARQRPFMENDSPGLLWIGAHYAFVNLITYIIFIYDKRASKQKNNWRMTSLSLHTLELLGGIGGSWLARIIGRHKTDLLKEFGFNAATAVISALHIGYWIFLNE